MQSQPQSTPKGRPPRAPSYFELQATWGVTKHFGGTQSTDELVALCGIDRGAYVLDIGCGTGMTPCYLAGTIGRRVVGVDISERMIAWSRRRAQHARLDDHVTFSVADAQNLPFADGTFDAVICESVTAFVADKPRAVGEYARVIRPGGYVGLTEGAWITPPPADLAAYLARVMAGADFLAPDAWSTLLAGAGLTDLVVQRYTISARSQWKSELRRMDRDDLREYLRAWKTFGSLLFTSAPFRRYLSELWPSRRVFHMFNYFGYGVFVGRKSATGTQARKEQHDAGTDPGAATGASGSTRQHPSVGSGRAALMGQGLAWSMGDCAAGGGLGLPGHRTPGPHSAGTRDSVADYRRSAGWLASPTTPPRNRGAEAASP